MECRYKFLFRLFFTCLLSFSTCGSTNPSIIESESESSTHISANQIGNSDSQGVYSSGERRSGYSSSKENSGHYFPENC